MVRCRLPLMVSPSNHRTSTHLTVQQPNSRVRNTPGAGLPSVRSTIGGGLILA
jgi:hypothetical protein